MGILSGIKNAYRAITDFVSGTPPMLPHAEHGPRQSNGYQRTTTASRRADREASVQYLHESTKLEELNPQLAELLGVRAIQVGPGITYQNSARGHAKRESDIISEELGLPNKLRRRMRSAVRARMEQMA